MNTALSRTRKPRKPPVMGKGYWLPIPTPMEGPGAGEPRVWENREGTFRLWRASSAWNRRSGLPWTTYSLRDKLNPYSYHSTTNAAATWASMERFYQEK